MASAVIFSGPSASERPIIRKSLSRRILDAIIQSRMVTAERMIRRYQALYENAQVYGDYRRVRFGSANVLPFNN